VRHHVSGPTGQTTIVTELSGRDLPSPDVFARDEDSTLATGHDLRWLHVLRDGVDHTPYCLLAQRGESTAGVLPLALVRSRLFGRFLVSLPYVNSAGVRAVDNEAATQLVTSAVGLANRL